MADVTKALIDLLSSGQIESLRIEAVLKPTPVPSPDKVPMVTLTIGSPRLKE